MASSARTRPSFPSSTMAATPPRYVHRERAVVAVSPSTLSDGGNDARVFLEAHSSLILRDEHGTGSSALASSRVHSSPFPDSVLDVMLRHKARSVAISVGSTASSTFDESAASLEGVLGPINDGDARSPWEASMGPGGVSVSASLVRHQHSEEGSHMSNNGEDDDGRRKDRHRFDALLRSIAGHRFIGSTPLDSIRVPRNGHTVLTGTEGYGVEAQDEVASFHAFLPSDAGDAFSREGLKSFASLLPCSGNGVLSCASSAATGLSTLLLGTATDGSVNRDQRRSIWLDLRASEGCFEKHIYDDEEDEAVDGRGNGFCEVSIHQGVSYAVSSRSINEGKALTLGDVLPDLGDDRGILRACPLADSSDLVFVSPSGGGGDGIEAATVTNKTDLHSRESANGLHLSNMVVNQPPSPSSMRASDDCESKDGPRYSIRRTVLRPRGVSNGGTFVTSIRNGVGGGDGSGGSSGVECTKTHQEGRGSSCDASEIETTRVRLTDIVPGHLVRPVLHTMSIQMYEGGGAGDEWFVPRSNYAGASTLRDLTLRDLPAHRLDLRDDGTVSVELTVDLPPDSSLWFSVEYDPLFLPFERFPADPNRGVDVPPSLATFYRPAVSCSGDENVAKGVRTTAPPVPLPVTLYSSSLLIMPPVPDMSMPFNVISLTSTLYAFILGSTVNFLVRKSTERVKRAFTGEEAPKNKLAQLKEKLREKFAFGRGRKDKTGEEQKEGAGPEEVQDMEEMLMMAKKKI